MMGWNSGGDNIASLVAAEIAVDAVWHAAAAAEKTVADALAAYADASAPGATGYGPCFKT